MDREQTAAMARILDEVVMDSEVSVHALFEEDYLKEFYDFYEIQNRDQKLIPSPYSFHESLKELCGDSVWRMVAEMTEKLFGVPKGITEFENIRPVIDEMEGEDGLAPFFFVFDMMFYEYGGFTLCFITGTNN